MNLEILDALKEANSVPNIKAINFLKNMTEDAFLQKVNNLQGDSKTAFLQLMGQKDFTEALKGVFPSAFEKLSSGNSSTDTSGDLTIKAPSELNADGYVNLDQATMDKENSIKNFLKGLNSDIQNAILYNVKKHVDSNTV